MNVFIYSYPGQEGREDYVHLGLKLQPYISSYAKLG